MQSRFFFFFGLGMYLHGLLLGICERNLHDERYMCWVPARCVTCSGGTRLGSDGLNFENCVQ